MIPLKDKQETSIGQNWFMPHVGKTAGLRPPREAVSYKMVEDELALLDESINKFWDTFKSNVRDTCQMVGLRDIYKDIKSICRKAACEIKGRRMNGSDVSKISKSHLQAE